MRKKTGLLAQSAATPSLFGQGSPATLTTTATAPQPLAEDDTPPRLRLHTLEHNGQRLEVFETLTAGQTTLYRDESGERFYRVTLTPRDKRVEELPLHEALVWAVERCFEGLELRRFLAMACAGNLINAGQGKGIGKQLGKALARNLGTAAARAGRSPMDQIRTYVVRGLAEADPSPTERGRSWTKKRHLGESRAVQLELATGLVEVVRKLETTTPSEAAKLLPTAQLAAAELAKRLNAESAGELAVAV